MINILYLHQSSELYGSDKTLLYLVSKMKFLGFNPIVVLPSEGPLFDELQKLEIEMIIAPVIKISRNMFTLYNLITLPKQALDSFKTINKKLNGRKIDIVHSNTLAVLTGALYAKRYKIKHLWHIHEIITHPKSISNFYPKLVNYFSDVAIFNSMATQKFMTDKNPKLVHKANVILNGFDRLEPLSSSQEINNFRKNEFKADENDVIIGLVGRISRWKGQLLLLQAFKDLEKNHHNVKLAFIGSPPPNQPVFLNTLIEKIKEFKLEDKVKILPFQSGIWKIWDSIDIATVPSTEPEPFGLVAIEAMLAGKPLVVANHGGLTEIVINNETGFLFEPENQYELKEALIKLIESQKIRSEFGEKGFERAVSVFSLKGYTQSFEKAYLKMLEK